MASSIVSQERRAAIAGITVVAALATMGNACGEEPFATSAKFSLTYTFTTSTPASPIDVGGGKDLTVNRYLVTTINEAGKGFLNLTAGRCTNIRFTDREMQTIDSKGYCNFKDRDGDVLFAEYTTEGSKPIKAITLAWTFKSGTGKYDGISGTAKDFNSANLDDESAYQAAGRMVGSYKILHHGISDGDSYDPPEPSQKRP